MSDDKFWREWGSWPDEGYPTLDEYTTALRQLELRDQQQAQDARMHHLMTNTRVRANAMTAASVFHATYAPPPRLVSPRTHTALETAIGHDGFARLLINANGETRIVLSYAEEQDAKRDGWKDPNH